MWIASCTKLVTAVSVMQCVEKGLLDLDADVSTILPEFKEPSILKGFNEKTGEPIYEKAKNKITLRLLMTHSSGLSYTFMHPKLQQLKQQQGKWPPAETESFVRLPHHSIPSLPCPSPPCHIQQINFPTARSNLPPPPLRTRHRLVLQRRARLGRRNRRPRQQHHPRLLHVPTHLPTPRHEQHDLPPVRPS